MGGLIGAGYNVFAIPIAAGVLFAYGIVITLAVGAILMSASTLRGLQFTVFNIFYREVPFRKGGYESILYILIFSQEAPSYKVE